MRSEKPRFLLLKRDGNLLPPSLGLARNEELERPNLLGLDVCFAYIMGHSQYVNRMRMMIEQ